MLLPSSYPINPDELIYMKLRSVVVPLFKTGYPTYADEDLLEQHRITEIEVTPVLYERKTPEWYDGNSQAPNVHEWLLFFDPEEFPVDEYGLILGDISFAAHISAIIGDIFPRSIFGEPEYTEFLEQNDDYVSMRYPIGNGTGFSKILRDNVEAFAGIVNHNAICDHRLISPMTAERYRQSIEPHRPDHNRPKPPSTLYAGMWITDS